MMAKIRIFNSSMRTAPLFRTLRTLVTYVHQRDVVEEGKQVQTNAGGMDGKGSSLIPILSSLKCLPS